MNNQPAETTTAPPAVLTETRMTAQISQIRTVADGTAKFRPTAQIGGYTCGATKEAEHSP
jgi:hypothetical protein